MREWLDLAHICFVMLLSMGFWAYWLFGGRDLAALAMACALWANAGVLIHDARERSERE